MSTTMCDDFTKMGYWISKIAINGVVNDGWYDVLNDPRPAKWLSQLPHVHTVLECGSLEGGHTALLARQPGITQVVGLEGREANLDKCRVLHSLLGITNSTFRKFDLENDGLEEFEWVDAVFCTGVLYHLQRPVKFFNQIVSANVFLGTHYSKDVVDTFEGMEGRWYDENVCDETLDPQCHLSGLSAKSFWLTLKNIETMLANRKYKVVDMVLNDAPNGPWVDLILER